MIDVTDSSGAPLKADVTVTYGNNVAFGSVNTGGTATNVALWMPSSTIYGGTPTISYTGAYSGYSWDSTGRLFTLVGVSDGDFRIKFNSPSSTAAISSSCALE